MTISSDATTMYGTCGADGGGTYDIRTKITAIRLP
jgi:hypothetical protein